MKSILFSILALIVFSGVSAQQAFIISGSVKDLNGDKLPGAGVYVSGSRFATATDSDGNFALNLLPGNYELVVKLIGFKTETSKIVIADQNAKMHFKLMEQATTLAQVTIKGTSNRQKYLGQFIDLFIGITPNAKSCKILNPEVLSFEYNQSEAKLSAISSDFLIIENEALGYRIKYLLESFQYDEINKRVAYKGSSYFEDLTGNANLQKRWAENRLLTYYGSSRHFFSSLYQRELKNAGFTVMKVINKPNADRPPDSLIKASIKRLMLSQQNESGLIELNKRDSLNYWINQKAKPPFLRTLIAKEVGIDTLVHDIGNSLKSINCKDQLYVAYTKEREDNLYENSLDLNIKKILNLPGTQISLIKLLQDDAVFSSAGNLVDPQSVFFSGYWGWKNVAEVLPSDYSPPIKQ